MERRPDVLHAVSTMVLLLLATGLYFRRHRPRVHFKFMVAAFVTDVLLLIYIEVTRHAVETVVSEIRLLLWFHVGVSLGVFACYVTMIVLGRRLLHGHKKVRVKHRNLGITFCVLRSLNYVTSFMV